VFDGLTALVSAPETAPQIVGIIIGSTIKGLIVGVLVGWYASRVHSLAKGMIVGLIVAAFFAFLIAAIPSPDGTHYYWEIILPGSIVGSSSAMPRNSLGGRVTRPRSTGGLNTESTAV
jgi:MFS family permease